MSNTSVPGFVPQQFRAVKSRDTLRYAVQIKHGHQIIEVVVVRLEVVPKTNPRQIKDLLMNKIKTYILSRWPTHIGVTALIQGRIDAEF